MTVSNLAIVWAPNLLWATSLSPSDAHRTLILNQYTELTIIFISEADYLFNWSTDLEETSISKRPYHDNYFPSIITLKPIPRTSSLNSSSNLSFSYSDSMILLPTFTTTTTTNITLSNHRQYSIPCLTDTLSTTITTEQTPQLTPRSDDGCTSYSGSLSCTLAAGLPISSESISETNINYETGDELESNNKRDRTSFSSNSLGDTESNIGDELKESSNYNNGNLQLSNSTAKSETPRPIKRYCSTRRKAHKHTHSEVNSSSTRAIKASDYSPPLLNIGDNNNNNNNDTIPHKVIKKTSPKKENGRTEENSNTSSFKKNHLSDKKRLPSSPITKRTLKKRPGRMISSSKRTAGSLSTLPATSKRGVK